MHIGKVISVFAATKVGNYRKPHKQPPESAVLEHSAPELFGVAATFGELKLDFSTLSKLQRLSVARSEGKKRTKIHQICILAFYSLAKNYIKG
jgi:hypothetical protein